MRINKPWLVHKWLPVFTAMPRMLRELKDKRDAGLLGYYNAFITPLMPMVVQYWRSFEDLEEYARNPDSRHWPAWVAFNKAVASNGEVGIWHETFKVAAGQYESIYNNMPVFGLGSLYSLQDATGERESAAARIGPPQVPEARPAPAAAALQVAEAAGGGARAPSPNAATSETLAQPVGERPGQASDGEGTVAASAANAKAGPSGTRTSSRAKPPSTPTRPRRASGTKSKDSA
jgi:hypothetical protein